MSQFSLLPLGRPNPDVRQHGGEFSGQRTVGWNHLSAQAHLKINDDNIEGHPVPSKWKLAGPQIRTLKQRSANM